MKQFDSGAKRTRPKHRSQVVLSSPKGRFRHEFWGRQPFNRSMARISYLGLLAGVLSCSGADEASPDGDTGASGGEWWGEASGGVAASGGSGGPATGGAASTAGGAGGADATGGAVLVGGASMDGGAASGGVNSSGGGSDSASGGGTSGTCADLPALPEGPVLDCGSSGVILQASGDPNNRVNYVIVGDGYTEAQLDGAYLDHIQNMLTHEDGMFGALSEPYRRYRKFINICALKVASQDDCIDDRDTARECDTAFDGYGDDASRLGIVDDRLVRSTVGELMPPSVFVDWLAVTINAGSENWWNSGGAIMVWNGGFGVAGHAASVALHEGGHSFHALADEYEGTSTDCSFAPEINVSTDDSGAKWAEWLGYVHEPGTGEHGVLEGARYCSRGIYRPTGNSEMNQLPDHFNMPSMQKIIHDIYQIARPLDAHTDNSEPLVDPMGLQVRVVDPDVVQLEWSVDGVVQEGVAESCFSTEALALGEHLVQVRAYDDTPWVRDDRSDLEQTVSWSVVMGGP